MPRMTYRPEEIIAKMSEAEVLLGYGKKMPEVIKALGIHEVAYSRWRKEHGGLSVSRAERLKDSERENAHLRGAVSEILGASAFLDGRFRKGQGRDLPSTRRKSWPPGRSGANSAAATAS